MSRSNPQLTNPATRFFEWSGSKGELQFYDKEQEKRIRVPLPFEFMPLDQLSTIVGYSKRDESGYWSNEVRNITNDKLTVRTKHGIAQEGVYGELADVRAKGAKYAKSIYIAYQTKQGWEIGNIKAAGSALSAWIEFSNKCVPENGKVVMTCDDAQDAPTGQFFPPKFEYKSCIPAEDSIAVALDRELQIYLKQYIATNNEVDKDSVVVEEIDDDIGRATPEEIAEAEAAESEDTITQEEAEDNKAIADAVRTKRETTIKAAAPTKTTSSLLSKKAEPEKDVVIEDIPDEPIDLDDIPF